MKNDIAIKVENVSKVYALYEKPSDRLKEALHPFKKKYHTKFHALDDVSFEIKKGEVVGIIGKNGSGKSTLLKIITKILTPSKGKVFVQGNIAALLELGAGFNPELTGRENIYLNGSLMGFAEGEMKSRIDEIISFADIAEFIEQPVKMYSSGMKARLGFAISINVDPDILIVDEALSVGDVAFQRKCFAKIDHFCKDEGKTVLFVSHAESTITQLCDRAIMLYGGKKIIEGPAKPVVLLYAKLMNSNVSVDTIRKDFQQVCEAQSAEIIPQTDVKTLSLEKYDAAISSKSLIAYAEDGARISQVCVKTVAGERVNVLEHGHEYIYEYRVDFFENIENVHVAMLIKTVSGLGLGGKNFPLTEQGLEKVHSGETLLIQYRFRAIMNEGDYFFNCGVNSSNYGIKRVHHRLQDAYQVKVLKHDKDHASGLINFSLEFSYEKA